MTTTTITITSIPSRPPRWTATWTAHPHLSVTSTLSPEDAITHLLRAIPPIAIAQPPQPQLHSKHNR